VFIAHAHACLCLGAPYGAAEVYRDVLERFPTSVVAPSEQHFLAVSLYKHSHKTSNLRDNWRQLQMHYPESLWRLKQSCVEKV
jgi:hypothetical protein